MKDVWWFQYMIAESGCQALEQLAIENWDSYAPRAPRTLRNVVLRGKSIDLLGTMIDTLDGMHMSLLRQEGPESQTRSARGLRAAVATLLILSRIVGGGAFFREFAAWKSVSDWFDYLNSQGEESISQKSRIGFLGFLMMAASGSPHEQGGLSSFSLVLVLDQLSKCKPHLRAPYPITTALRLMLEASIDYNDSPQFFEQVDSRVRKFLALDEPSGG